MKWKAINGVNDSFPEVGQVCLIAIDCTPNIERGVYIGDGNWRSNWCGRRGRSECYKVVGWTPFDDPEL